MNLYIEGSKVLHKVLEKHGAIKNLVYTSQYENKPQLLGLVCETLKYGTLLQQIVDSTKLLTKERLLKGDNLLAQTLVHDFVVGREIRQAGRLKQVITRNRAALTKKYDSMLANAGVSSWDQLLPQSVTSFAGTLPRYVRINLLKSSVSEVTSTLKSEGWEQVVTPTKDAESFRDTVASLQEHQFLQDPHLFDLLVFPPRTDFHDDHLLTSGKIILQDKASCFPAHVLSPPEGSTIFDCCAAPGNKSSHVASLINNNGTVFAYDKDGRRMATLQGMMRKVGVTCVIPGCQDFLKVDAHDDRFKDVEYMLVDPSCSGSGIVNRMNEAIDDQSSSSSKRLDSLSNFQVTMLKHAMTFPNLKRLVYSTCSIHLEENEEVIKELETIVDGRFKVCKVFPDWPKRGLPGYDSSDCFLRMSPEHSLTNGFFVACFERIETSPDIPRKVLKEKKKKKKRSDVSSKEQGVLSDNEISITSGKKRKCEESMEKSEESFNVENTTKKHKHGESEPDIKQKKKKHCHTIKVTEDQDQVDNLSVCVNGNLTSQENNEDSKRDRVKKHKKKHKQDLDISACSVDDFMEAAESGKEDNSDVVKIKKHKKKHKKKDLQTGSHSGGECIEANETVEDMSHSVKKHKKKHKQKDLAEKYDSIETQTEVSHHKKKKKHKHRKD
ncbi:28S rRNA (cytosine-C(5))-methyltransferase-like [Ylistrum balloti]|uniref:28S rRNA (cytosine-C(5))-methyltransferase-like n=1 Tax=Ylistrum balloti TaxID=509963 RepID=UPI002905D17F|nr:28S rRNA (cytosine-C(5))-methyltransferase-like [Ylistrum balloti]